MAVTTFLTELSKIALSPKPIPTYMIERVKIPLPTKFQLTKSVGKSSYKGKAENHIIETPADPAAPGLPIITLRLVIWYDE